LRIQVTSANLIIYEMLTLIVKQKDFLSLIKSAFILVLFFSVIDFMPGIPLSIRECAASDILKEDYKKNLICRSDWACNFLKKGRSQHAFLESYAISGISVCYDITRDNNYFEACRAWANKILLHQKNMTPPGAYYMNYGRKPSENQGEWYIADSSCIAMGILAVYSRSIHNNSKTNELYLSLTSFADLVINNFVRKSGGVTDGYWKKSDKEWWCSTALFGAFSFLLYEQTNESKYFEVGLNAIDWLLNFDYKNDAMIPSFEKGAPTVLFYILEAYSAALPYLKRGSERQKDVLAQFSEAIKWLIEEQNESGSWNYKGWWGSKQLGLARYFVIYEKYFPKDEDLRNAREKAFKFLKKSTIPKEIDWKSTDNKSHISFQETIFGMMSFAEKLDHSSVD